MKSKIRKPRRPSLPRTSDEMKQWSAMLGHELRGWPHITTKPMFGLMGFYRKKAIFAALPATRGIGAPNSIIFKNEIHAAGLVTARERGSARFHRNEDAR